MYECRSEHYEMKNKSNNPKVTLTTDEKLQNAINELSQQKEAIEKRAAELVIANKELVFQNEEKEKRAEELIIANKELEEKEFFLRESQNAGNIGSYKTNFITGYWQSSEALDDIFGIDKSYIRSIEGWKEIVHPDDQNKMDEYLRLKMIDKQKSFDRDYRIVRINDKQTRWVHGLGEVKFDDSGNATQMIGTIQDITERKKAEQKLLESKEMLSQSQKLAQMGSWGLNVETGIISWSAETYKIFNCDPETFTPTPETLINLLHPEDRELLSNWISKALTGINQNSIVYRLGTDDGTIKYIRGEGKFVLNKAGKVIRLFGTAHDITERIESEEKMFQLSAIINATSDFVGIASSADQHITFLNKAGREALGFEEGEDVSETKISDYYPAWVNELLLKEAIPAAMKTGKWSGETVLLTKAGVEIPISQVIILHTDENGKPEFLATVARDITESKKVEENLRQSEVRFRAFFENSPVPLFVFDLNLSKFVSVNFAAERLFKFTKKELTSKGLGDLSPEFQPDGINSKEKIKERIAEALDGEKLEFEWVYIIGDGSEILTETRLSLLPSNGSPLILASAVNITERKRSEKALQLTQFAFDNASDAIFWMSSDALIVNVNEAACVSLGYTEQELLNLSVPDIDPDFNLEMWSGFFPELREKHSISIETTQLKKDGSLLPVEIRSNYIKFGDKEFSCAFVRDITERKKVEQNIERQNKELQKTNIELDRFVYSVSHDLRSPLKSLLGLTDIISDDIEPENKEQLERLQMMKQSVIKLDNFIEDILHYSRNSRMEVTKEEIYFEEAINDIRRTHEFMEGRKRLKLKLEIQQSEKFISDKRRVNVILSNLLSNAIKYQDSTKENPFVNIMVQCNKENAIISVEDNGIGIAEKNHEKIFEMFYRATTLSSGSGLGMYILKEMTEKLGGTIAMESKLGKGTKFTITIPN